MYKVSLALLILHYNGYGGKASLLKLHLFSWALRAKENMGVLMDFVRSDYQTRLNFFGIESTLNRALNLAYAEELVDFNKNVYSLLPKGKNFVNEIEADEDLFFEEKKSLKSIGRGIPEKVINDLVKAWKNA